MFQRQQSPRILIVAMVFVALVSIALYYVDAQFGTVVTASRVNINRTYELERAFQALASILEEAESGQRGYLLTGKSQYLNIYAGARERVDQAVEKIRRLTRDKSSHMDHVEQLAALSARKIVELEGTVALIKAGHRDEAIATLQSGAGERLMGEIREVSAQARADELSMLDERQAAFDMALAQRRWLRRLLMMTSLIVTASAFYLVFRLQRLQTFATMCAWSRTIQLDGQWVTFEEYLARRFNVRVSHGIAPRELDKLMTQVEQVEKSRERANATPKPSSPDSEAA